MADFLCEARRFIGLSGSHLWRHFRLPFAPYPGLAIRFSSGTRTVMITVREVVWDESGMFVLYGDPVHTPDDVDLMLAWGWSKS